MAQSPKPFILGFTIIIGALGYLAYAGYEESKAYYHTVQEVKAMPREEIGDRRFRVEGDVEEGSIEWVGEGVDFRLLEEGHLLAVQYRGKDPVPDTFRDGSQAVVEGTLREDGTFHAMKIQAKCASKYEAEYDYENHTIESAAAVSEDPTY